LNVIEGIKSGHWPSLAGAWLHFEVSFMTWLLIASLGVPISEEFGLSPTQKGLLVACPLLSGALLRICVGLSSDRLGAKVTGLYLLAGEMGALVWGWLGGGSFVQLLGVGLLLGVAGASFAVALPIASRAYPPAYQGLAMGIAASANSGTVLSMFLAPRVADVLGWHGVFGVTLVPVLVTTVLFGMMVQSDAEVGRWRPRKARGQWWQDLREGLARPSMHWLCLLYAVTFGGFVGVCSFLPIFLHDQYEFDRVTAGSVTALGGLLGSFIRPLGGYLADRLGGMRVLPFVFAAIAATVGTVGWLPEAPGGVTLLLAGLAAMGFGNGVVFQVVSDRFSKQMGLASGLIGAAGGIGGFLLPLGLGGLKDLTGTYATGLWCFAVAAVCAWVTVVLAQRRAQLAGR
jgi:NNP family nitrate/nitrite transporter-like MFS transporter